MPDMNTPNAKGKTIMDYIPLAMQKLGLNAPGVQEEPVSAGALPEPMTKTIDKKDIADATATLKKYKEGKSNLESRIVEEERWWKLRHWEVIRGKQADTGTRPEPTSAWLFNSLSHKHADVMDNYPEPNVLPREQSDEMDAKVLSSVIPVVFERNNYEETYSDAAWYKLKHGFVPKGVFWDKELEDGMGDVSLKFVDALNLFWEPGITDLQASRNLFNVSLVDNDLLEQQYPDLKGKLDGQVIDVKQYVYDDNVDVSDKSVVVDWYYKRRTPEGKNILHLCKFVGNEVLFASEGNPEYPNGFYDHGEYPFVFDVLYPEEGTPVGFGLIAIMKDPQMYIDKLSQAILENTVMSARPRFWAKKTVGINKEQFLDWNNPIVDVEGDISEERLQPIQINTINSNVLNVLQMKIEELKETSANRDFNQGGSGSGVTSGAALAVLQEAGNKTSRDMISGSFRSYAKECYLVIELLRQFYTENRTFRITGDTGRFEYIQFNNQRLQGQPIPPAYPGQELEPGYVQSTRKPVFDIIIRPQKRSPYSKLAQNELAKELYNLGFFNPQLADQSLTALELMDFDGEEKVKDRVQQGMTLMNQLQQMQMMMQKMGMIIYKTTGQDVLGLMEGQQEGQSAPQSGKQVPKGESKGSAIKEPQTEGLNAYGERLVARTKPDMNAK
jgi:hypothetical protein